MKNFKVLAVLGLLAISTAALSACNTLEGFGQDVENTGEAVQRAAN